MSRRTTSARSSRRPERYGCGETGETGGNVTEVFENRAEREAAYRLLSNDAVTSTAIGEAMFAATATECASHDLVYVTVDGSSSRCHMGMARRGQQSPARFEESPIIALDRLDENVVVLTKDGRLRIVSMENREVCRTWPSGASCLGRNSCSLAIV